MVINKGSLRALLPLQPMSKRKRKHAPSGTSYGLTECGYDIRIKQHIEFRWFLGIIPYSTIDGQWVLGHSVMASSIECFNMPPTAMGLVLNKSTWARLWVDGSRVTNIEPGWRGHLTIELQRSGHWPFSETVHAGAGVLQVIFLELKHPAYYNGKYQDQADKPVDSIGAAPKSWLRRLLYSTRSKQ